MKLLNLIIALLLVSGMSFSQTAGEFVAFNAEKANNAVAITWTPTERKINHFEIQKSKDGMNWKVIAIMFPFEDSSGSHSYKYADKSLIKGNCYYRIRQIDINKKEIFSRIRLFSNTTEK